MNKDRERGERRGKGEGRGFRRRGMGRRKVCRFCADKTMLIDYKDSRTLGNFLSELGKIGDVVRVKPGYARNYLLPRGLAVEASPKNLRVLEHQKRVIAAKADREHKSAEASAKRLDGVQLTVRARAGEEGRLFGSVTNMD